MATEPATTLAFRDQLLRAAREPAVERGRFFKLIESDAPADVALRDYARRLHQGTRGFARRLYALCGSVPHAEVRAQLVENILEEEGFVTAGGRVQARPPASHVALAARFARACGWRDEELDATPSPRGWFEQTIHEGRWLAALAYLVVGVEANGAPSCVALLAALRRRGFSPEQLAFFELHGSADLAHSEAGLSLVERFAVTPGERGEALAAAQRGARDYRLLHECCLRARRNR